MGIALFFILLAVVAFLAAFAFYLLVRILKVYLRARRLERMRGYETIMYAALQKISPEQTLRTLLVDADPKALEEVLLRMGDGAAREWREKIIELYELSGFTHRRMRGLHSRLKSRRVDAARRLGRIGEPRAVPRLNELSADPSEEVREAALFALERMGEEPVMSRLRGGEPGLEEDE